jgi:hypothetical protein
MPIPPPLLAAIEIQAIVAVIVLIFWVVSWLIKQVAAQNRRTPPVGNRSKRTGRERDESVQQEIDIFIQELAPQSGQDKPAKPPAERPRPQQPASKKASRREGLANRGGRRESQKPSTSTAGESSRRNRPGEEFASRHAPVSADLGANVTQHLKEYMADKVSQEVNLHLQQRVRDSVADHLGTASPPVAAAPSTARGALAIGALLRDPDNLRQAMILNLILTRPKSLTRRSDD